MKRAPLLLVSSNLAAQAAEREEALKKKLQASQEMVEKARAPPFSWGILAGPGPPQSYPPKK